VVTPAPVVAPAATSVSPPVFSTAEVASAMAMADSAGDSGALGTAAPAVVSTGVRSTDAFAALQEASGAAARACGRAVTINQTAAMQRLGRYINAVNGRSASGKTLNDVAAMVASASAVEDGNDNLQVVIHISGVSTVGDLSWESIFGRGAYVDPDVLRIFGKAHQFCRRRDVLSRARLAADAAARLVGTIHRGQNAVPTPNSPTPIATTAEDEEMLDAFTSPADDILRPPVSIKRLARKVARAHSASPSSSPVGDILPDPSSAGSAVNFSTVSDVGAASGVEGDRAQLPGAGIPFVLESITPPAPVTPVKSAVDFMTDLFLNRRAPVQLLGATLKAVIMFCAMHFGLSPRQIMEGFSRWWVHLILDLQVEDGAVVAPRWPMGVKVPSRFLSSRFVKAASKAGTDLPPEQPVGTDSDAAPWDSSLERKSEEYVIIYLDLFPSTECHCKHKEAVAVLLLLWTKEPRCRSAMQHEVFKADHAALRRKAAPKRKSPCGTAAQAARDVAPVLAPRPAGDTINVGRTPSVLTTRAAARAAARGSPFGCVEGAAAVQKEVEKEAEADAEAGEDEPASSSPAKRTRQVEQWEFLLVVTWWSTMVSFV